MHGPLQATLLVDLVRRELPGAAIERFAFRAVRPLFDTGPFLVCGHPGDEREPKLWIEDADGCVVMDATATLA